MTRYFSLLLLTLPLSASAIGSAPGPEPASFFVGGCGLIFLMVVQLTWKTKKTDTAAKAELSSGYETSEFPLSVGFPNSAHSGGGDS
ncbi:MAG TPA: hypothetical protein VNU44_11905 [Bryobacteraceae bacterium]|jgi:hypothetical protein|nr:hypothetical protein [Bryobacteraceae bacterium]